MTRLYYRKAFTLAEVLITLGIIGVVAALTIPVLMQNIQNAQFKAAFKKEYSILSQAAASILNDGGGSFLPYVSDDNTIKNTFKNYLKYSKDCDYNTSSGTCWHSSGGWYSQDGTSENASWGNNQASLMLNDGTLVEFLFISSSCSATCGNISRCANIFVDVNGFNKPNQIGKDIFVLNIQQDRIAIQGKTGDCDDGNCGTTKVAGAYSGCGCAAWVIEGRDY